MRIRLLFIASSLLAGAFLASCGSGNSDTPDTPDTATQSGATGADASPTDARRFVFGAEPGKPVVYWIHTDW